MRNRLSRTARTALVVVLLATALTVVPAYAVDPLFTHVWQAESLMSGESGQTRKTVALSDVDLVVIDGGPEQLNAVLDLLPDGVESVGLAKARANRTGEQRFERIFKPGQRTAKILPPDGPETYLLARLRDEAHRFAITYHRRLRSKRTIRSALDDIPGLGPKRRTMLLKAFGSATGVKNASREELAATGLPKNVVEAIEQWAQQSAQ